MQTISRLLVFIFLLLYGEAIRAQSSMPANKLSKLHSFYLAVGTNLSYYSRSDIRLKSAAHPSFDFTLHNVRGKDDGRLDFSHGAPQYSYALGYYNHKKNWGIEYNFDHIKYYVRQLQRVHMQGIINGRSYDRDTLINPAFVYLEHSDGANYDLLKFLKWKLLYEDKHGVNTLNLVFKAGAGPVIPKTNSTIMGKHRDDRYNLAGYVVALEGGLRYNFTKHWFAEANAKGAYADYTRFLIADGRGNQQWLGLHLNILVGRQLDREYRWLSYKFPLQLSRFRTFFAPLQLSVIIVNYNVKHFLEQCLYSLQKSTVQDLQVIVVDNQSTDDSIGYLQPRFPSVQFLQAGTNLGFAKACNKGLQYATGNYILFLNPDTIVAEDTLERCIHFFETNADAGAVGVRMLDGSGRFLKESKRAFPSPLTSLFKLFGLSSLFPRSKTFSRYYLGHLDANKNHKVDVLAGAFMMVRKHILEKLGSFDEAFFMYGEDIDLSYRIQKVGYQNYYLAETEIIHFKGESTKRGSLNYVRMFYQAMSIFVHKHYGGAKAGVFNAAIHFAIWLRALISAMAKMVRWIGLPLIDAIIILLSFWLVKEAWANVVKGGYEYPGPLLRIAFPAFTFIYLLIAYYTGLYNKTFKQKTLVRSAFIATLTLLACYSLLPEQYRFSRGIVLFGSLLSFALIYLFRLLLLNGKLLQHPPHNISKPYILIAGSEKEFEEVKHILQQQKLHRKIIDRISVDPKADPRTTLQNMEAIALASDARELILCIGRIPARYAIHLIRHIPISTWFHLAGSSSIVGSDLSYTSGEVLTTEEQFNLAQPHKKRIKRLLDMLVALVFLASFPLHFISVKRPLRFISNSINVLIGRKTWIGYHAGGKGLPPLRQAVISELGMLKGAANENAARLDYWYARNYEPLHDVKLILRNYRNLGV